MFRPLLLSGIALAAALQAQAIAALVEATAIAAPPPAQAPIAAVPPPLAERPGIAALLARNPFDHVFALGRGAPDGPTPSVDCAGVRATVVVRAEDQDASFAALDVGGTRLLRRRGDAAGDLEVAWIGADRVWLVRDGVTCEAPVFAQPAAVPPKPVTSEPRITGVERVSADEVHIDRGVLDRYLDSPGELAQVRVAPDARGLRIMRVPKGSVLAVLGVETGDRLVSAGGVPLTSPEKILEVYARLRSLERLSIVVERKGATRTMDYVVR